MPSRSRRSSTAIAVAVFLAGAALLGLEIAASRVLAPYFGNSLYVWGALIGVVLAGLSTGYWLGGVDRRPLSDPAAPRRDARGGLAARARDPASSTTGCSTRSSRWDPGPRLNPLLATIFLFGAAERDARHRLADRRAAAGALDRRARPDRGAALRDLDRRLIAGTFATAFWLIPELGTDQVLASAPWR